MKKTLLLSVLCIVFVVQADWAQDQLISMSVEQKVGQLFIPGFRVNDPADQELITQLIAKYHVGGVLLFHTDLLPGKRHTSAEQAQLIQKLQQQSELPLFIAQDLEWGLLQRLRSAVRFPYNMTLGAIANKQLIYELGKEIGRQCKLMGVHINFAPVVDVNNNPSNPVINDRSFGQDKHEVAERAILFAQGLQDAGVIGCAKHFPGHGDTDVDSHLDLPVINHTRDRFNELELYPFRQMIAAGIPMIMMAHLHIPALDDTPNLPASLSKKVVTDLLQDELGFTGLIVTDGLRMHGVEKHFDSATSAIMAVQAGNDLLIDSRDPIAAIEAVVSAVHDGTITIERLDKSVLKILRAKQSVGLEAYRQSVLPTLEQFHTDYAYQLKGQLYQEAITLVRDDGDLLPLSVAPTCAAVFVEDEKSFLHKRADNSLITTFSLQPDAQEQEMENVLTRLQSYSTVLVGVFGMNKYTHKNFGVSPATVALCNQLQEQGKNVIVTLFGSPYAVNLFDEVGTVLVAYEDDVDAQFGAARVLAGVMQASGTLPISV